jgi:hypothetical protein
MTTPSFDPSLFHGRDAWSREAVTSPPTTLQAQMGKVFGYLKGLHATHLINTGVKLGLFALGAEPQRPDARRACRSAPSGRGVRAAVV